MPIYFCDMAILSCFIKITIKNDFHHFVYKRVHYLCRDMRKVFAFGLSIIIVAQAFYNAGVTAYWLANRAYIASALCENRDKPQSKCNGKCYLKKKLAQAPDNQNANSSSKALDLKKGIELAEPLPENIPLLLTSPTGSFEQDNVLLENKYTGSKHIAGVFHPPC